MYFELYQGTLYSGLSLNRNCQFNGSYLESVHQTLINALNDHKRTFLFHVILRYPINWCAGRDGAISRFIRAFKAKVEADLQSKRREGRVPHQTRVRYVWVREVNESQKEHYHVFILVNNDTYYRLGHPNASMPGQLSWMVSSAWASSIGLTEGSVSGLVEFSGSKKVDAKRIPDSHRKERDGVVRDSFESAFHWMTYICKIQTKRYGDNERNFGCSRN